MFLHFAQMKEGGTTADKFCTIAAKNLLGDEQKIEKYTDI
tara:strand:+ start:252 stop:371 length:120 start_codon:yes stop_codon:yes gene_type:complete